MGINYRKEEHQAVFSSENKKKSGLNIWDGYKVSKNLFLRNAKGDRHYLVVTDTEKKPDLRLLAQKIGSTRLSFGSEQRLEKYLKVKPGSVSAFCVLNDEERAVTVIFDEALRNEKHFALHPNENTATIFIEFNDVEKVVREHGNEVIYAEL